MTDDPKCASERCPWMEWEWWHGQAEAMQRQVKALQDTEELLFQAEGHAIPLSGQIPGWSSNSVIDENGSVVTIQYQGPGAVIWNGGGDADDDFEEDDDDVPF